MFISSLAYYCPQKIEITKLKNYDDDLRKTALITGAKKICVEENLSAADLSLKVTRLVLKNSNISSQKIRLIITAGSTPRDENSRSFSAMIQDFLGAKEAICFGISEVYCSSFHASFLLTRKFFETSNIDTAIIVVSDKLQYHCIKPMTLFSDNASAVIVNKNAGKIKILSSHILTLGRYNDLHYYSNQRGGFILNNEIKYEQLSDKIIENGIMKILGNSLNELSLNIEDISFFIFDNLTNPFKKFLCVKFPSIKKNIVSDIYKELGHLGATDTIFSINGLLKSGKLKNGDIIASITIGMGIALGCSILRNEGN